MIKKLFTNNKKNIAKKSPPGRTFKRVLTGRYFGCEDLHATPLQIAEAKQGKIDQIQELELIPMYVKYRYEKNSDTQTIIAAHVAFQKEVLAEKWNMVHVSEISFIVNAEDFDEFEKMSGTQLTKDFRDVTPSTETYEGKERRKERRNEL